MPLTVYSYRRYDSSAKYPYRVSIGLTPEEAKANGNYTVESRYGVNYQIACTKFGAIIAERRLVKKFRRSISRVNRNKKFGGTVKYD